MKRAMTFKTLLLAMLLVALPLTLLADTVYCRYCGSKSSSISSLTASKCSRHPDGAYKGCHVPVDKGTPTGNGSKVYCEYCGASSSSISSLTASKCSRHPKGAYKGAHSVYSGSQASKYQCKYCGNSSSSISSLTSSKCSRHPNGAYKGYHAPY